jgi:hypothetical protein
MIAVTFQSTFHTEIHENKFLKLFLTSAYQNKLKKLKNKNINSKQIKKQF